MRKTVLSGVVVGREDRGGVEEYVESNFDLFTKERSLPKDD